MKPEQILKNLKKQYYSLEQKQWRQILGQRYKMNKKECQKLIIHFKKQDLIKIDKWNKRLILGYK